MEHEKSEEQAPPEDPQLEELRDLLLRTQANFENYRKQAEKRLVEMKQFAARDIIVQILPVLDNLELALKNVKEESEFVNGVKLIYAQLVGILEHAGIQKIETSQQQFDPYYHEALLKVVSELPENTILEEFQKGYILHDKVIRHAKVKISAGKQEEIQHGKQ